MGMSESLCVCMHVCMYVYRMPGVNRGQERASSDVLELQVVVVRCHSGGWELNACPLQERHVLLITGPMSLAPIWIS